MAHGMKSKKDRCLEILNYDPEISLEALSQRLGITKASASGYRCEWNKKRRRANG